MGGSPRDTRRGRETWRYMKVVSLEEEPKRLLSSPMCWFLSTESIPLGCTCRMSRSVSRFHGFHGCAAGLRRFEGHTP